MKLRQLVIAALAVSGAATLASANDMSTQSSISQLQQALNDKGYNAGPVDGVDGPKTQAALKQFQQSQGIAASGKADNQTLAALGVSGGSPASSQSSDTSLSSSPSASQGASSMGSSQPPSSSTSSDQSSNSSQQSGSANTSQSSPGKY